MRQTAVLFDRTYTTPLVLPERVIPLRYSHAAEGGPQYAEVQVGGTSEELCRLLGHLRCPVEIHDEEQGMTWWGYVHEVQVALESATYGRTLDRMANKVRIAYELASAAGGTGTAAITDWLQDADSVAEYGVREVTASLTNTTAESAESRRARVLATSKVPIITYQPPSKDQTLGAMLYCRGWWQTLSWRHYSQAILNAGNLAYANGFKSFARVASSRKLAQSVVLTEGFHLYRLAVTIARTDYPWSHLRVRVCGNSGGAPNLSDVKATATWDPVDLHSSTSASRYNWQYKDVARVWLAAGTYWFVWDRVDEAVDGSKYYLAGYSTDNQYASGAAYSYDGSNWNLETVGWDYLCILDGEWETSTLITDIVTDCGQFLTLDSVPSTGIYQHVYRDGRSDGLTELREVLSLGTSGGSALRSRVGPSRRLSFAEEPAVTSAWRLSEGRLLDDLGHEIPRATCPTGNWVQLQDVAASGLDIPAAMLEVTEYDCATDQLKLEFRDQPTPWEALV